MRNPGLGYWSLMDMSVLSGMEPEAWLTVLDRGRRSCMSLHGETVPKLCSKEEWLGRGGQGSQTWVPHSPSFHCILSIRHFLVNGFERKTLASKSRWVKLVCFIFRPLQSRWSLGSAHEKPPFRDLCKSEESAVLRYWDLGLKYNHHLHSWIIAMCIIKALHFLFM